MDKKTLGQVAGQRSTEETGGDNFQGGVGRSGGEIAPRWFLAAGQGEGQNNIGINLTDAIRAEQGERGLAPWAGPRGVEGPELVLERAQRFLQVCGVTRFESGTHAFPLAGDGGERSKAT